jgi:hypothetical protein
VVDPNDRGMKGVDRLLTVVLYRGKMEVDRVIYAGVDGCSPMKEG